VDVGQAPDIVEGGQTTATTHSHAEVTEFPPLGRLMSISVRAREVLANQEKAIHWLRSPNPSLEGKTPLEAAPTD
jgi:uncharacterized protein (DUF2384 family)